MVTLHDVADVTYDSTLPVLSRQDGEYTVTLTATTDEVNCTQENGHEILTHGPVRRTRI